jgi:dihydrodipicolinate synthase/N-acetylneuraminate lyase
MGIRAMIAGMNNWAPEIITALTRATQRNERDQAERLYLLMMDLSAKMHFTDSTIASLMALYARGYEAGFPRKPMGLPAFDSPRYAEIKQWLQAAFMEAKLEVQL